MRPGADIDKNYTQKHSKEEHYSRSLRDKLEVGRFTLHKFGGYQLRDFKILNI